MIEHPLDEQIAEARRALQELETKRKEIENLPPSKRLATILHDKYCGGNHIDGCGWFDEIKGQFIDWSGHSHKKYLEAANKLVARFGEDGVANALEDYDFIRDLRL